MEFACSSDCIHGSDVPIQAGAAHRLNMASEVALSERDFHKLTNFAFINNSSDKSMNGQIRVFVAYGAANDFLVAFKFLFN